MKEIFHPLILFTNPRLPDGADSDAVLVCAEQKAKEAVCSVWLCHSGAPTSHQAVLRKSLNLLPVKLPLKEQPPG